MTGTGITGEKTATGFDVPSCDTDGRLRFCKGLPHNGYFPANELVYVLL